VSASQSPPEWGAGATADSRRSLRLPLARPWRRAGLTSRAGRANVRPDLRRACTAAEAFAANRRESGLSDSREALPTPVLLCGRLPRHWYAALLPPTRPRARGRKVHDEPPQGAHWGPTRALRACSLDDSAPSTFVTMVASRAPSFGLPAQTGRRARSSRRTRLLPCRLPASANRGH
jgi:hypothetical protein